MNDCIKTMWETAAQRDDLWNQARYEKFAELIVAECIQTIQMGITRDGHNTEHYLRSVKHIKQIREHFGVEE
jgi:pyruvate dehydrogenase complex dehydrogenase (E1) component